MNRVKRFTPGPWRVHTRAVAHVTSEYGAVANCGDWYDSKRLDEQQYNAYLIAAAPELLEALEWAAGHPYAGGKSFGDVEPIKSALAKAYGEES